MKRKALFDDDDDDGGEGDGKEIQFKTNKEFAKKYEAKKKREELALLEKKYAEQLIDEEEEEEGNAEPEDEDARYDTEEWQQDFLRMIPMLRSKNPKVYEKDTHFFDEADGLDEQAQIKAAFSKAAADDDGDDESLLSVKKKTQAEQEAEDAAFNEWQKKHAKASASSAAAAAKAFGGDGKKKEKGGKKVKGFEAKNEGEEVLMRFWKEDAQLDDADKYLRKYIWNRMWLDDSEKAAEDGEKRSVPEMDEEDDEELDREDDFERAYNFRFEEPNGATIQTFPRQVAGSMREDKKATRRAEKRKERRERKEQEKIEKRKEFERLKTLQKEKIGERIHLIEDVLGTDKMPFDMKRFEEEDFDPDKWAKQMDKLFDDDFYSKVETEKPVFEKDDYIDSTDPLGRPEMEPPRVIPQPQQEEEEESEEEAEGDDDAESKKAIDGGSALVGKHLKKKAKKLGKEEALAEARKAAASAKSLIDQYYTLDFEDMIGDMPCRFHYTEVDPDNSGLTVSDVLEADDDELAKIVPIKSIAPYLPPEEQITRNPIPAVAALKKKLEKQQEQAEKADKLHTKKKKSVAKKGKKGDKKLHNKPVRKADEAAGKKALHKKKEKKDDSEKSKKVKKSKADEKKPKKEKSVEKKKSKK